MAKSSNRLLAFVRRLGRNQEHAIPNTSPAPTPRRDFVIPLQALTPSAHLDRMSAIVRLSFSRVETVNSTQALARQQLDVADYTLRNIMDELRTIMPAQFPGALTLAPLHATPAYGSANGRMAAWAS